MATDPSTSSMPAFELPALPPRPPAPGSAATWQEWDPLLRWLDLALRHADLPRLAAWRDGDVAARNGCAAAQQAIADAQRGMQALLPSVVEEVLQRWSGHDEHTAALAAAIEHLARAVGAAPGGNSSAPPNGSSPAAPSERAELVQVALAIYLAARASDPSPSPDAAVGEARGLLRAIG